MCSKWVDSGLATVVGLINLLLSWLWMFSKCEVTGLVTVVGLAILLLSCSWMLSKCVEPGFATVVGLVTLLLGWPRMFSKCAIRFETLALVGFKSSISTSSLCAMAAGWLHTLPLTLLNDVWTTGDGTAVVQSMLGEPNARLTDLQ